MQTEDNLNRKLDNFRKQLIFFKFLKNVKRSTEKKYTALSIYYFSIKSALRKFIENVSSEIKQNHLYKLMLTFKKNNRKVKDRKVNKELKSVKKMI